MNKVKAKWLILFIVFVYIISLLITLKVYRNNSNQSKVIYKMYMFTDEKHKYDKITKNDLICIDVTNVTNVNKSTDGNINYENKNEIPSLINKSNLFFEDDELEKKLQNELFISLDKNANTILSKDEIITYDDVIKDKILNYSYNGLIAYEIKYQKRLSNDTSIKDDFKEIKKKFEYDKNLEVGVFIQNKTDFSITKIIDKVKLVDINDNKATICISQNDMKVLNDNIDSFIILISMDEIEKMEVYINE